MDNIDTKRLTFQYQRGQQDGYNFAILRVVRLLYENTTDLEVEASTRLVIKELGGSEAQQYLESLIANDLSKACEP